MRRSGISQISAAITKTACAIHEERRVATMPRNIQRRRGPSGRVSQAGAGATMLYLFAAG
jgi:hypothetical protein